MFVKLTYWLRFPPKAIVFGLDIIYEKLRGYESHTQLLMMTLKVGGRKFAEVSEIF